jgi:hypothetical protein
MNTFQVSSEKTILHNTYGGRRYICVFLSLPTVCSAVEDKQTRSSKNTEQKIVGKKKRKQPQQFNHRNNNNNNKPMKHKKKKKLPVRGSCATPSGVAKHAVYKARRRWLAEEEEEEE